MVTINELTSPIECLHADVLTHIFAHCDQKDLFESVPFVCKRFKDVLATPTCIWQNMRIDLRPLSIDEDSPFDGAARLTITTHDAHIIAQRSRSGLTDGGEQ